MVRVVPTGRPASSTRRMLPPAISTRVPVFGGGRLRVGGAGFEGDAGDGGDGGEGLAAETEGGDGEEVVGGAELGGGVAFEGEEGVVADHAVAVVGDADELAAAGFDVDADAGGAGVEGVFEELFDDGGGALDDLAGGDLVGDLIGEDVDATHGVDCTGRDCGLREERIVLPANFGIQRAGGDAHDVALVCSGGDRGDGESFPGRENAELNRQMGAPLWAGMVVYATGLGGLLLLQALSAGGASGGGQDRMR